MTPSTACRCFDRDMPLPHEGHCCLRGDEAITDDNRLACGHDDDALARDAARRAAMEG